MLFGLQAEWGFCGGTKVADCRHWRGSEWVSSSSKIRMSGTVSVFKIFTDTPADNQWARGRHQAFRIKNCKYKSLGIFIFTSV